MDGAGVQIQMDLTSTNKVITQYFSKWRNEWIDFKNQPPGPGEIMNMRQYHYQLK